MNKSTSTKFFALVTIFHNLLVLGTMFYYNFYGLNNTSLEIFTTDNKLLLNMPTLAHTCINSKLFR